MYFLSRAIAPCRNRVSQTPDALADRRNDRVHGGEHRRDALPLVPVAQDDLRAEDAREIRSTGG